MSLFPILGIEGGGTKTTWCLLDENEKVVKSGKLGPGNVTLLDDYQLGRLFEDIKGDLPCVPCAVGVGLAGVVNVKQKNRVTGILRKIFGETITVAVDHDAKADFLLSE